MDACITNSASLKHRELYSKGYIKPNKTSSQVLEYESVVRCCKDKPSEHTPKKHVKFKKIMLSLKPNRLTVWI